MLFTMTKQELDCNYDYNDTNRKSYGADVGWLNKKWMIDPENIAENMEDYWLEFDDNVEYEKENR